MSHLNETNYQHKSRLAREGYDASTKICLTCYTGMPYEKRRNRFCSQSCNATHNKS